MPVPKNNFHLQKNNILNKWSQVENIVAAMILHDASTQDHLNKVLTACEQIDELTEDPCLQFLQEQLQLMKSSANGRRYSKHVLIFAAELICVSPGAYRLLRSSQAIILPREKLVRDLI